AQSLVGVPDEKNLVVRAARLLRETAGVRHGTTIHIEKNLPMGGGLGGGSSDAATTLMALNSLWGCGLDTDRLATLGLALGADVPVFVRGRAAWAEGIGEQLTPVEPPESWYLVLVPRVTVSTAAVFAEYDRESHLTPVSPPIRIRGFHADLTQNDLASIVRRQYPEVDNALKWLGKFGEARMTGSGGCVFLAVESAARGEAILAEWSGEGFVARGYNRHPLLEG
ncbi:MAG: 4-(cytidine 5'-diphospho)-2-C-methyl-D-erythritol kinase, partial [Gammaproteobacteria bacterium]|nr:4-(cytidine 5'-diphospho)-2-C-methyl-D-erythritol kinase [Gammaproteobacteria bacterium]